MKSRSVVLDANLLVLFVVGRSSRSHIARHKRLQQYDIAAYELLAERLAAVPHVVVTPNVLTEASNLLSRGTEPARSEIMVTLQALIQNLGDSLTRGGVDERYVPSAQAAARGEFVSLGLTDSAILESSDENTVLLTDDLELYLSALRDGHSAEYFTYSRRAAGIL